MRDRVRNRNGFTLVELMIVVAIIGILAAIAIPNFMRFRLRARTSEAKSNLGGIRSTEIAYYAEWSWYIGNQPATPSGDREGKNMKLPWLPGTRFSVVGFTAEGSVFYDYALLSGGDYASGIAADGLTMVAIGDLDGDSVLNSFSLTHSTNEIVKDPDAVNVQ